MHTSILLMYISCLRCTLRTLDAHFRCTLRTLDAHFVLWMHMLYFEHISYSGCTLRTLDAHFVLWMHALYYAHRLCHCECTLHILSTDCECTVRALDAHFCPRMYTLVHDCKSILHQLMIIEQYYISL